jgi:GAF domain-containing protein
VVRAQQRSAAIADAERGPARLDDERAYLYQIIQTIGSGPDLETILGGIVRLATQATGCHACLIWFLDGDRLVLRSSSAPYEHLAGVVSMELGEGLAGWVVKTRRSAFIKEQALKDPRVKYFPEFEEERFQSLVSVPVFDRDGGVMGVISLHAEAPHEFVRADLDFLEHTASLMSGAVENARLYEEAAARVDLLTDLSSLLQRIAGATTIEHVFATVTAGTRQLLGADRAEVYLADADRRLRLREADPPRRDDRNIDTRTLWSDALRERRTREREGARLLATTLWGDGGPSFAMFAPLEAGDEHLGLLVVAVSAPVPGADTALTAVAAHTAVTIKQHQLIERLQETSAVKDFFRMLGSAEDPAPSSTAWPSDWGATWIRSPRRPRAAVASSQARGAPSGQTGGRWGRPPRMARPRRTDRDPPGCTCRCALRPRRGIAPRVGLDRGYVGRGRRRRLARDDVGRSGRRRPVGRRLQRVSRSWRVPPGVRGGRGRRDGRPTRGGEAGVTTFEELGPTSTCCRSRATMRATPPSIGWACWSSTTAAVARSCSTRSRDTSITTGTSWGRRERCSSTPTRCDSASTGSSMNRG